MRYELIYDSLIIDNFDILEKWLESCVKHSSKNKKHLCDVINWLTCSPCISGAWCNCSTQRETCNCQESSKKGRSIRATIHLLTFKKCFSCPLVVGLTMLLLRPPSLLWWLSFLWILLKNFYFLPCGFDHDEVVPIKACLES
jgi:hypothetical protein